MKNGRILLVAVGFLVATTFAFGQNDYAFKVLANKGNNEVKSGDSWVAVKTGMSLKKEDELKVSENSYLGLVHASGKPIEIKTVGAYKVSDLASTIGPGTSVLNKYTDFILSSNSAEAKKNRLSATGGMHRGTDQIKAHLPENQHSDVFNNIAIVNWEPVKNGGPYIVTTTNMFGDVLSTTETPETKLQLKLDAPEYANESNILVEIKSKGTNIRTKEGGYLIKKMTAAQSDKVKKAMSEFSGQITDETALNKFILAGFYEENKLFIDAISAYEQAVKLAPDVPSYKEAYDEFLLRNNLIVPKQ
jgi:hypothetical protein